MVKGTFIAALAAAIVISGTGAANAHFRHPAGYYAGPDVRKYGQVNIMDIADLEKKLQDSRAQEIEQTNKETISNRTNNIPVLSREREEANPTKSKVIIRTLPRFYEDINKIDCNFKKPMLHHWKRFHPIAGDEPKFLPAPQPESALLFMNDLDYWKNAFNGETKRDYVRIIATGMLYPERLPLKVQRELHRFGWNGYYYYLLKSKMNSDRFFDETVASMDRVIESRKNNRNIKLWETAVIEIIHTLNVHSAERTV